MDRISLIAFRDCAEIIYESRTAARSHFPDVVENPQTSARNL
jgi:hypothetical protein